MAYSKTTASLVSSLVLIVSLALILTIAESDQAPADGGSIGIQLSCSTVHGVKKGETCEKIAAASGIEMGAFTMFNPGLDCEKLFVGEWVCTHAAT